MDMEAVLGKLGLSRTEARVYLCLLAQSPLPAATVADLTGTSRSSVYVVLRGLVDKGLLDAGTGYSSRYRAVPPQRALAGLLERERAELRARERHLDHALPALGELFEKNRGAAGELVEVLRTPKLVAERFDRLQSEARETIDIVVRSPIQVGGPNDAELTALRRGVRARALYDDGVLADPSVYRHLATWVDEGEQARVYLGELPMKFALFDAHSVVMPLASDGSTGVVAIIVRSRELAAALGFLFDTLWEKATPLASHLADSDHAGGHHGQCAP